MRFFKISVYPGLTLLMLCIGIMTSQATQIEEISDHTVNGSDQKPDEQFEKASEWSYQPASRIADRQALFQNNTEINSFRPGLHAKTLLGKEMMHKSVDYSRFNERFYLSNTENKSSAVGIERNLIEYDYDVQADLLHQRTTNEDTNGELRGWYTVGVVSAFLITGTLIYFLSGDDGATSIPEPPGRP